MFRLEIRTELATLWFARTILIFRGNDCCLRSRRLEELSARKKGAREGDRRFSLARARSFLRSLLPSACYAGYNDR